MGQKGPVCRRAAGTPLPQHSQQQQTGTGAVGSDCSAAGVRHGTEASLHSPSPACG